MKRMRLHLVGYSTNLGVHRFQRIRSEFIIAVQWDDPLPSSVRYASVSRSGDATIDRLND